MKTKLAIVGCGNMASAIVLGLAKKSKAFDFVTYTPTQTRAKNLAQAVGGKAAKEIKELQPCEYFLIACKPQQYDEMAAQLKIAMHAEAKIISVVTGISTPHIQKTLGVTQVARAMPNTPCLIGEGTCAIFFTALSDKEKTIVENIFSAVAQVFLVDSDDAIDASTAVIGSGPAYIFEIARILAKKYAALGIEPAAAEKIVQQVIRGSAHLMQQSADTPETLREQVTSKGGTTFAALEIFRSRGFEEILDAAVDAAYQRAKQLSR